MSKRSTFGGVGALVVMVSPAFADVTAPQIWAEWQEMQAGMGSTLTVGSENYAGGVLTLDRVMLSHTDDGDDTTGEFAQIVMRDLSDGTVQIELSPVFALSTEMTAAGTTSQSRIEISHESLQIIASGDADSRVYNYTAAAINARLLEAVTDGTAEDVEFTATLTDLTSTAEIGLGAGERPFKSSLASGALTLGLAVAEDDGSAMELTYIMSDITTASGGMIGDASGDTGLTGSSQLGYAGAEFAVTVTDDGEALTVTGDTGEGAVDMALSSESLSIGGETKAVRMQGTVPGFPVPVEVSMDMASSGFTVPMGVTNGPRPVALNIAYRGVKISDVIWGMFDPQQILPRDPATIAIDLTGMATTFVDMFAGSDMLEDMTTAPAQIDSASLNELTVEIGGAKLTGAGAVTFDNAGPMPEPLGKLSFALTGGFALLDKLSAIGLMPAGQAMGIKGMAGMVARPVGDDQLVSDIEFTPGGGIVANGMVLK
jgi:hypothetical protein